MANQIQVDSGRTNILLSLHEGPKTPSVANKWVEQKVGKKIAHVNSHFDALKKSKKLERQEDGTYALTDKGRESLTLVGLIPTAAPEVAPITTDVVVKGLDEDDADAGEGEGKQTPDDGQKQDEKAPSRRPSRAKKAKDLVAAS